MRPLLRRCALISAMLLVAYLVLGNVLINAASTQLAINSHPNRFTMTWSKGLTWFPGFVVLWQVEAKGHVRHILWSAQTPRIRGHIALSSLLFRELRVASADAMDVVVQADFSPEEILPLDPEPNAWTLRFDSIRTSSLHRLRLADVDAEVTGEAAVGFVKRLHGGPVEVLPSSFDLASVRVLKNGHELLRDATAKGGFAIARHQPADVRGLQKLALTDATIAIDGAIPPEVLALDPTGSWSHVPTTTLVAGSLRADVALRQGVLQEGGRLDIRLPVAAHSGTPADPRDGPRLAVDVESTGSHVVLHIPAAETRKGALDADFRVDDNTVASLRERADWVSRISGNARLDWRFASLDWLAPLFIDRPWVALEGSGHVDAEVVMVKGALQTGSRITVADINLIATIAGFRFRGLVLAEGRLAKVKDHVRAQVQLAVPHFEVEGAKAGMSALLQGDALRIDLDSAPTLAAFRSSLVGHVRFNKAVIPDLNVLNAYLPSETFGITGGKAELNSDLALDGQGRVLNGDVRLSGQDAQATLGQLNVGGDFDLDARVAGSDPRQRFFNLDGSSLKTRNVRVTDNSKDAAGDGSWANLTVNRGRVEATKPLVVDADVDTEFENISFLLGLFGTKHVYPKWALKLADAGVLHATSTLHIDRKTVIFDPVVASNGRVDVKARMRFAGKYPTGDLFVRWGLLSFGLEVEAGKKELHLLGARRWYDEQPALGGR